MGEAAPILLVAWDMFNKAGEDHPIPPFAADFDGQNSPRGHLWNNYPNKTKFNGECIRNAFRMAQPLR